MNNTHNVYGYEEAVGFATFNSQTSLQYNDVKKASVPVNEQQSFSTKKGQVLGDLVTIKFKG